MINDGGDVREKTTDKQERHQQAQDRLTGLFP